MVQCEACDGSGLAEHGGECPICSGTGEVDCEPTQEELEEFKEGLRKSARALVARDRAAMIPGPGSKPFDLHGALNHVLGQAGTSYDLEVRAVPVPETPLPPTVPVQGPDQGEARRRAAERALRLVSQTWQMLREDDPKMALEFARAVREALV